MKVKPFFYSSYTQALMLSLITILSRYFKCEDSPVALFVSKNVFDFNKRLTRYQVEHIAGRRGSRTKYIPPMCATLQTHGVCHNKDELCQKIRHPLAYYRRKLKTVEKS